MTDDQMKYESKPVKYWEYRNFKCTLYCLRVPDDSRWLGYVRVGDEWTEVLDRNGTDPTGDPEQMEQQVEDEVDSIIREVIREETNQLDWPFDDPVDPNPGIDPFDPHPNPIDPEPDPIPGPNPRPPNNDPFTTGPHYGPPDYDHPYIPIWQSGTVTVQTTDGSSTLVDLSDLNPDDVADDGLYIG